MQGTVLRLYQGLSRLIMVGLIVQIYLAGVGAFGASTYELHRTVGYLLGVLVLALLVLALAGRAGRRLTGATVLLVALFVAQVMLSGIRERAPYVAALHVVNALAILGVTSFLTRAGAVSRAGVSQEALLDGATLSPASGRGERVQD